MAITRIKITNFKSFKNLDVELGNFNVLIGANASGKSNFLQIFKFLRDTLNYDLENAISMQGGVEYLRNMIIGSTENFSLEITFDQAFLSPFSLWPKVGIRGTETVFRLGLRFMKRGQGFRISEDRIALEGEFVELELDKKKMELLEKKKYGQGKIVFTHNKNRIHIKLAAPKGVPKPDFTTRRGYMSVGILLDSPNLPFYREVGYILSDAGIYDFDPKLPKKAVPITGKIGLEEDGSNLALVLKNILANREKKRKFSNLMKYLLPFVDKVHTERFTDKSLLFKLREIYFKRQYLPGSLVSDGTINIIALIVALYFEKRPLIIIEEPERNMHPSLISRVMKMMKEVSQKKQIIFTTHNPEVVKHTDIENLLLVSRDKQGFSTITRPGEKEEVKTFLKNDMGIEDLYVQNLLEM